MLSYGNTVFVRYMNSLRKLICFQINGLAIFTNQFIQYTDEPILVFWKQLVRAKP